jgi:EAL domain-containing protein (putative c-di-GMP-specific phosphodiesterase class I)
VAEGVESFHQLRRLAELGCDEAQGYLLCRPVCAEEFVEWMAHRDDPADLMDRRAEPA